jgi:hypothetical protein
MNISANWPTFDTKRKLRETCRPKTRCLMTVPRSDVLVVFGATGDLAHKKIFPALQAMIRRGHLDMPVIGVGRSKWTLDQFKARAKESLERHGGDGLGGTAQR